MRQKEHELQKSCVTWFRLQYTGNLWMLLFAIPNGGQRNIRVAQKLKAEGVVSGVADLFLSVPNEKCHGLYIELKFGKNKQTENQKQFQKAVEKQGYKYALIYSFNEFIKLITEYLNFKT